MSESTYWLDDGPIDCSCCPRCRAVCVESTYGECPSKCTCEETIDLADLDVPLTARRAVDTATALWPAAMQVVHRKGEELRRPDDVGVIQLEVGELIVSPEPGSASTWLAQGDVYGRNMAPKGQWRVHTVAQLGWLVAHVSRWWSLCQHGSPLGRLISSARHQVLDGRGQPERIGATLQRAAELAGYTSIEKCPDDHLVNGLIALTNRRRSGSQ